MEQAEISPRPVVGAIVVVSGLAVSFLLWLLYVHHASADFAGRWMFLPALNALLNGSCAIALCVGLYFIKHHNREAHRTSMLLAFAFSSVFLISYIVNHTLHGDTIFPGSKNLTGATGLEPAISYVTGRRSNLNEAGCANGSENYRAKGLKVSY